MTRFSVIIPTYNREAYLLECLETVFAQTHPAHEVIVVDDGSTDGTVEALSVYAEQIQILQQTNSGPGAARNRGAQAASGDYLAFLDSDDLWFPWTLATFAELIERHANPSLLFGRYMDFWDPSELSLIQRKDTIGDTFADYLASHSEPYFGGAGTMVVSRSVFLDASGFVEDLFNAEDHDLALKLGTAQGFVQVVAPTTLGRRLHHSNATEDVGNNLRGLQRLIASERSNLYPGTNMRRAARIEIISRHIRPQVIAAAKSGSFAEAWSIYKSTFSWNLRLGRLAYLLAAPVYAFSSSARSMIARLSRS